MIVESIVNGIIGLIGGRIGSMTDEEIAKLVPLINKLIDGIPTDLPIPGTGLHIDAAFSAAPLVTEHGYFTLPVSFSM